MARVTVEDALRQIPDRFAVVHLSALRYRQLHRGSRPLVECKNKDVVRSIREIATGRVKFREEVMSTVFSAKQKLVSQRLDKLAEHSTDPENFLEESSPLI